MHLQSKVLLLTRDICKGVPYTSPRALLRCSSSAAYLSFYTSSQSIRSMLCLQDPATNRGLCPQKAGLLFTMDRCTSSEMPYTSPRASLNRSLTAGCMSLSDASFRNDTANGCDNKLQPMTWAYALSEHRTASSISSLYRLSIALYKAQSLAQSLIYSWPLVLL